MHVLPRTLALFVAAFSATSFAQITSGETLQVRLRDTCDPITFNAALGPGVCIGNFKTTLDEFIAELTEDSVVGSWRIQPLKTEVKAGTLLMIQNQGGELHTLTRVQQFGGGFVPLLNDLSRNPVPAPECAHIVNGQLVPTQPSLSNLFVPAKQSAVGETIKAGEAVHYQCCLHPWMRMTVKGKAR